MKIGVQNELHPELSGRKTVHRRMQWKDVDKTP